MPEIDEFDLVDDEELRPTQTRYWLWFSVIFGVGIFAFLVGIAFVVISSRLRDTAVAPTPAPPPLVGIGLTPTAPLVLGAEPLTTETVTPTPEPTATEAPPTDTPVPATPTAIACIDQVDPAFSPFYQYDRLGCPLDSAQVVWSAWEEFERGYMLWRSDTDQAYVLVGNGAWYPVEERWDGSSGRDAGRGRGGPPPGLRAPERGFGAVWERSDAIFADLGWARTEERGFCATIQRFAQGAILASNPAPACTAEQLYNHASASDWTHFILVTYADGSWSAAAGGLAAANPAPAPAPVQTSANVMRPEEHGVVIAWQLDKINFNANFKEWPDRWQRIGTIVHGADRRRGSEDLSGAFQAAWLPQGLILAVRVRDDVYRAAPAGTRMWQGDGLEIHFDRLLAADYDSTVANEDDYQIGISFGPNLDTILAYHWLPHSKESNLNLSGAARPTEDGYALEVLIPWDVFDLDGNQLSPGMTFGFNISINDNDGNQPAQEKVASFSPARTTHDNPTQWATLVLGE